MTSLALKPQALSIMGIPVVPFDSYGHAAQCVEEAMRTGRKSFCVAINPEKIQRARVEPELEQILREADFTICDGIGVAIAARLMYGRRIKRCTGVDFFFELIQAAEEKGWRVFLLGASPDSNRGAYERLCRSHPRLRIVGRQDGYFKDDEEVLRRINDSGADLLFVAMGSPRQEYWISRYRNRLTAAFCMGVGGTFDVISGKAKRAPAVFRKTGTEFLYRLMSDPKRWRRQLALPAFLMSVLKRSVVGPKDRF